MMNYKQAGDYLIPDLSLNTEQMPPLSKYGRMRRTYLQEHRPILMNDLLLSGKLDAHLREIDSGAQTRLEQMMIELTQQAGITEEMKARDPMAGTQQMNSLKAQAEEAILRELIYS